MISKKPADEPMIDLREKPMNETLAEPEPYSKRKPRGPTLYISDADLPLSEKDVDQEMTAVVTLIPRRVSITKENGKTRKSFDIEVAEVRFDG